MTEGKGICVNCEIKLNGKYHLLCRDCLSYELNLYFNTGKTKLPKFLDSVNKLLEQIEDLDYYMENVKKYRDMMEGRADD